MSHVPPYAILTTTSVPILLGESQELTIHRKVSRLRIDVEIIGPSTLEMDNKLSRAEGLGYNHTESIDHTAILQGKDHTAIPR